MHCNVTAHPTNACTLQQLREAIPSDHSYCFLIDDRDAIFSVEVGQQLKAFGLRVLLVRLFRRRRNLLFENLAVRCRAKASGA